MTVAHIVFLLGLVGLIVAMALRKNVLIPAVVATFATALAYDGNVASAVMAVFRATLTAGGALFEIFVVIAAVTSMLAAMRTIGADEPMVRPFGRWMINGRVAYIVLFVVTYLLSLFFWPTPALALIGAVLLPAAIKAGLPPLGAALALAISGQGMALASDYVIGLAPSISASGAGVPADDIADRALVLSLIVGLTAAVLAWFLTIRKEIVRHSANLVSATDDPGTGGSVSGGPAPHPNGDLPTPENDHTGTDHTAPVSTVAAIDLPGTLTPVLTRPTPARAWAIGVPATFGLVLVYMMLGRFTDLVPWSDGAGASLVGGTALVLMAAVTLTTRPADTLEHCATHFVDGLVYAFKAMGIILPVAGFVYLGIPDYSGSILGLEDGTGPAFLFDTVESIQTYIPDNGLFAAFSMLLIGLLIGLDGSGWAGLPLTGGIAAALAPQAGMDTATLAALAQNAATWTGGGTLVIWSSLIVVAGFCRVPVGDLVRRLAIPVVSGLLVATVAAVVIW
ncbi:MULTISPECIES: permease [Rhodococcus]|uniref:permease n=1 Tax=Rhodococcus TaxID=1827 RepID=UPI00132EA5B0|nr:MULTISPECIES: permease [Rhodococcus]QHG83033.1 permease [Rhodococcus rhodochrous]QOH57284.1 permease [Rhodococcus rhodochrous]WAL44899.1 permease [Rhodococcus pyridinivorans]